MEFSTIDEVITEVERRTAVVDSSIVSILLLYNSISFFIIMMNVLILICIGAAIFLTDILKGYEFTACAIYASVVAWEWLSSTIIRRCMDKKILSIKLDVAWNVFTHFKDIDTFKNDEELSKYFEANIIKHAGIRPRDK